MYDLLPNTFTCVNVILVFDWIEAWGSLFEKHLVYLLGYLLLIVPATVLPVMYMSLLFTQCYSIGEYI